MGVAEVGHSLSSRFHLFLKGFSLQSTNIIQQLRTCTYATAIDIRAQHSYTRERVPVQLWEAGKVRKVWEVKKERKVRKVEKKENKENKEIRKIRKVRKVQKVRK